MKFAAKEGFCYCLLTMVLSVLLTIMLSVNLLNFGNNGKSSYRRSLHVPAEIPEMLPGKIAQNLTVIELGASAMGVYKPEVDRKRDVHEIVTKEVAEEVLNIGFIICKGDVTHFVTLSNQLIASVKSILVFSDRKIIFRIVSNDVEAVKDLVISSFPESQANFQFDIRADATPERLNSLKEILKFKGCGHLKVTFHHSFPLVENLLLLDLDTILLRPVEELFKNFENAPVATVLAMATEHPWNDQGYYSHRPYAHNPSGLNGGLLMYNFTGIKEDVFATPINTDETSSFEDALVESINFHLMQRKQFLADQCAVNALFHHNVDKMHLLPCQWNLRAWGMMECLTEKCYCPVLKQKGGCALLHGQGRSFVPYKKNVGFFTVWKTFLDFSWDDVLSKRAELVIEKIQINLGNISQEAAQLDESGLTVLKECI